MTMREWKRFGRDSAAVRDARRALRALARRPAFTLVVVLVLALGIGATTAIFTLLDAVVLRPLPLEDPSRLVTVRHGAPARGIPDAGQCAAWHLTYADESRSFEALGMFGGDRALLTGDGPPEPLASLEVTGGVLEALRLTPVVGRSFNEEDMDPDGPSTVMLGEAYWRSRFGGDPSVVGRRLDIDGTAREVVGVVPAEVRVLVGEAPALVIPLRFRRASLVVGNIGFGAVARLLPDVSAEEAAAELNRILPMAWEKFPGGSAASTDRAAGYVADVRPLASALVGAVSEVLWVLMAGVAVLLLIACVDVGNLVLVRAEGRQIEMAVRASLGASGRRLAWEYLGESLLLGLMGGAVGLVVAYLGLRGLVALAPGDLPRLDEVALDARAFVFALAISLAAGGLFGLAPALRHRRGDLGATLRSASRGGRDRAVRRRLREASAVVQMALAFVLLVTSGLLLRSFAEMRRVDPGFTGQADLVAARLYLPPATIPGAERVASTYEAIVRRVEGMQGVTSATFATAVPMDGTANFNAFHVRGGQADPEAAGLSRRHKWIGGGYFETMGIRVMAGRAITWEDVRVRAPVAMLSEALASEVFGSAEAAVGRYVAARADPPVWKEVIGVAADALEDGPTREPPKLVYWPQVTLGFWESSAPGQVDTWREAAVAIRGSRAAMPGFRSELQDAIHEVEPNAAVLRVEGMPEMIAGHTARTSFAMVLLGLAGSVALVLGLVGVYGVVAHGVSVRAHELGMRLALGATPGQVLRLVLREGVMLALLGVGAGLGLAWAGTRFLRSLLFGVDPLDVLTLGTVATGLLTVAAVATSVAAARAASLDPVRSFRGD